MTSEGFKFVHWDAPDVEPTVPDEANLQAELGAIIRKTQEHNFSLHRHAFRATHVKTQGIVKGTFTVSPNLPIELAHGICSPANRAAGPHDVALRFANEPSFLQDDRTPGPRGCGMKIFGVVADQEDGFMHPNGVKTHTQDMTFNNAPFLELRDVRTTVEIFRIRERHFRCPAHIEHELKKRSDAEVQLAPAKLPNKHFLSYTMYSQSAYRWGPYVAKYALFPVELTEREEKEAVRGHEKARPKPDDLQKMDVTDDSSPEQHSQWLREYFLEHPTAYELRVQLCEDLNVQSVEDTTVGWDESKYPFRTVGRVVIHAGQDCFSNARRTFWDEKMALNVWHGLEAHKPLGSVNRIRKALYENSSRWRGETNETGVVSVHHVQEIPD